MATATKAMVKRLGPLDRGLPMTFNQFMRADYEEGYQYELIDGELYIVPGRPRATVPEPDQAAYHNFPLDQPFKKVRWQNVSPILVVEVVSREDPYKDLVRNVKLYLQVPTIQEYWLIDPRKNPERPIFRAYRRQGKKWRIVQPAFGEVYTTKLLPGFALIIDPRS